MMYTSGLLEKNRIAITIMLNKPILSDGNDLFDELSIFFRSHRLHHSRMITVSLILDSCIPDKR